MTMPFIDDHIYGLKEVAAGLKVNPRTVRRLVGSLKIAAFHIGAGLRFHGRELNRYLLAQMRESKAFQAQEMADMLGEAAGVT